MSEQIFATITPYYLSKEESRKSRQESLHPPSARDITCLDELEGIWGQNFRGEPIELMVGESREVVVGTYDKCDISLPFSVRVTVGVNVPYRNKPQAVLKYDGGRSLEILTGDVMFENTVLQGGLSDKGHVVPKNESLALQLSKEPVIVGLGDYDPINNGGMETSRLALLVIELPLREEHTGQGRLF